MILRIPVPTHFQGYLAQSLSSMSGTFQVFPHPRYVKSVQEVTLALIRFSGISGEICELFRKVWGAYREDGRF